MKRFLVFAALLLVLPVQPLYADDDEQPRRYRGGQRAVPGPQTEIEILCERSLEYGGALVESDERWHEAGPDDVDDRYP
jgi:hypothetical protein